MWHDREQAGKALAGALGAWRGRRPLVLAIPRGAVPMGAVIADALGGDLDVVLVHKIGHPLQPEVAVGAVDEQGHCLTADEARSLGVRETDLRALAREEHARLCERRGLYGGRAPDLHGRIVILVDDGVATGATMLAAVRAARAAGAAEVVVAAPVAAPDAAQRLSQEADAAVFLHTPHGFLAVGQYYEDFGQVEDDEVRALLHARRAAPVG